MNRSANHPTDEQLQDFIDNRGDVPGLGDHLHSCPRCREIYRFMTRMDGAMRSLPTAQTSDDFTSKIVSRLVPGPAAPGLFRILGGLIHLFGLFAVLAVMIGIFLFTGVIDKGEVEQGGSAAHQYVQQVASGMAGVLSAFSAFLKEHLPFAFGRESGMITLLVLLVVAGLAVADRLVGRKFVPR